MNNPYKSDNWENKFDGWSIHQYCCIVNQRGFSTCDSNCKNVFEGLLSSIRHSDRECYKQEMLEKIENHHTSELKILQESNNKETTKEYISKGLEIYKDSLISLLNEEVTK